MNVENILKVADAIEKHSIPNLGFNMELAFWETDDPTRDLSGHDCGTVACIAGWASVIKHGGVFKRTEGVAVSDDAAAFFGVPPDSAVHHLFYPDVKAAWFATPAEAVKCIRHFAATGEVDWARALSPAA